MLGQKVIYWGNYLVLTDHLATRTVLNSIIQQHSN